MTFEKFGAALAVLLGLSLGGCAHPITVCGTASTSHADRLAACDAEIQSNKYGGKDLAILYQDRGAYRIEIREYNEAIADFDAALAIDPEFADALINRAIAHRHLGETDMAISDLNRAELLKPNSIILLTNRAGVYAQRREYAAALADYQKAEAIASTPQVLVRMAFLEEKLGKIDDAIAHYTATMKFPNWQSTAAYRGYAYLEANKPDLARADFMAVASLQGDYGYYAELRCYGRARLGTDDYALALQDCDRADAMGHNDAEVHLVRGFLFLQMKRFKDAVAEYAAAYTIEPEWAASLYGRGTAKRGAGDIKGGAADIAAALAADKDAEDDFKRVLVAGVFNVIHPGYYTNTQ
jgi:tetratricopeptide (TPR) repeat protein